jgi:polysaccharide deacetylase family protein (PEP-CTERM system associated)
MSAAGLAQRQQVNPAKTVNAFTVDVEDYFQVEAFKGVVERSSWESRPSRVVGNTERVLALLASANVQATFFILGWVAERFPSLVRQIQLGHHEIASHGYAHQPASSQSRDEFRDDVRRAKAILEDLSGTRVRGYRAPTFSIGRANWWAYDVLAEEGYEYSSSVYPIAHDLYGTPDAPRFPFRPLKNSAMLEIPPATLRLLGKNRPCGGGGYFRFLPYPVSRWCIDRTNAVEHRPCVFYCHPWEFDPDQPRIASISPKSRFRHYLNLARMEGRAARLLRDLAWSRMDKIYLEDSRCAATWE